MMSLLFLILLIFQFPVSQTLHKCLTERYGNCQQGSCSRTTTGRTECSEGCVDGFWGTGCRIPCPEHCEMCDRYNGTCLMCSGDVYGQYCNITCDAICHGYRCNEDGTCSNSACQDGWFGANCSNHCNQTFLRCGKTGGECIACKDGFFGMNCELGCSEYGLAHTQIQETCIPGCANDTAMDHEIRGVGGYHTCTDTTLNCLNHNCTRTQSGKEICAAGCDVAYWGTRCRIPCPDRCQTCQRLQGKCTKCKDNLFGLFCNLTCQEECDGFQCNQAGTCSETVCADGKYGDDCRQNCGEGCKACKRNTGYCIKCKENHYGKSCDKTCPLCYLNTKDPVDPEHGCNNTGCAQTWMYVGIVTITLLVLTYCWIVFRSCKHCHPTWASYPKRTKNGKGLLEQHNKDELDNNNNTQITSTTDL